MPIDYKAIRKNKIKENREKVLSEIDSLDMKLKISNYCNLHGFSENEIRDKILNDEIFRSWFAKDPNKQNFAELAFKEFLNQIPNLIVSKLSATGEKALYLKDNGEVISGLDLDKSSLDKQNSSKSIDFLLEWKSSTNIDYKIFITHKYTNEEGGSQDNQFEDAKKFLKNAQKNNEPNKVFLAILDGDYYLNSNRLNSTNEFFGVPNKIVAITNEHLEGFLDQLP